MGKNRMCALRGVRLMYGVGDMGPHLHHGFRDHANPTGFDSHECRWVNHGFLRNLTNIFSANVKQESSIGTWNWGMLFKYQIGSQLLRSKWSGVSYFMQLEQTPLETVSVLRQIRQQQNKNHVQSKHTYAQMQHLFLVSHRLTVRLMHSLTKNWF